MLGETSVTKHDPTLELQPSVALGSGIILLLIRAAALGSMGMTFPGKVMVIYAKKYPEVMKVFSNPESGVFYKAFLKVKFYCVVPEKVFYIDNEQGFGKRQELAVGE